MREALFVYQLTPPYVSLWMCSWSCRVHSRSHFDHANHPKRYIHQVEWIVVSANLIHQFFHSITLKHNRMNIAEYSIVKYDWLELRKICDFKPIHQSNHSMRMMKCDGSNTHKSQWTEEKEDYSIQVWLLTITHYHQSPKLSVTGICLVKTQILPKYQSD